MHLIKIWLLVLSFYAPSLSLSLSLNCITAKQKGIKQLSNRHFMLQFRSMSMHQHIKSIFPFKASTPLLNFESYNKFGQRNNLDRNLPVTLWALELLHTLLNNLLCQQRNSHCFYNIKNKKPI